MASPANSIPDTQLGLSADEIQFLRRAQIAAAGSVTGNSSSRAASRASSQGLLLLDGSSLAALSRHFDRLMQQISDRIEYLSEQSAAATAQQYDRAGNAIEMADAEIARLNEILRNIDELEDEFDRVAHIKEIVRGYRQRVEEVERRLDDAGSRRDREGHSHRHGGSHTHSSHRHAETSGSSGHRHRHRH